MMILRLAIKNILGAGIRSWLNAAVISLALVTVIWNQSLLVGMDDQASRAMVDAEMGGGQYWQELYDPFDPLSYEDAHSALPPELLALVEREKATPVLVSLGTIYPQGRMRTVSLKGIDPGQNLLSIPSAVLREEEDILPVLIGARMAKATGLQTGDIVALRWREPGGAFNATDAQVVHIMSTTVQSIDSGQIWVPLERLRSMLRLGDEASVVVLGKEVSPPGDVAGWSFKDLDFLLRDIKNLMKSKSIGRTVFFTILMCLGMLAIFDTQVLAIFRRRREMGMLMALGFTRRKVIALFTVEGALHGFMAVLMGLVYGIPLLYFSAVKGFALPQGMDSFGFSIGEKIFPVYSVSLVLGVTMLVLCVTTFVSFLPTRKIAKLKPTDALRGRLS